MFYYLILGNPLRASPVSSIINLLSIFSGFSRHPNPCVPASDETGSEFGEQAGRWAPAAYKIQVNLSRGLRRPAGVKTRLN